MKGMEKSWTNYLLQFVVTTELLYQLGVEFPTPELLRLKKQHVIRSGTQSLHQCREKASLNIPQVISKSRSPENHSTHLSHKRFLKSSACLTVALRDLSSLMWLGVQALTQEKDIVSGKKKRTRLVGHPSIYHLQRERERSWYDQRRKWKQGFKLGWQYVGAFFFFPKSKRHLLFSLSQGPSTDLGHRFNGYIRPSEDLWVHY